jgi:hypothetical protein
MKTALSCVVAAATILGTVPAPVHAREVRIIREYDHGWHPPWAPPWARVWWRDECRVISERRYRPDGTVVVRRVREC